MLAQPRHIQKSIGAALTPILTIPCVGNQCRSAGRGFTALYAGIEGCGFSGDGQVQVDTVQQRAGQFVAIALNLLRRTTTPSGRLAKISTGTGIHCGHQLKACWKPHPIPRPGDHDMARLQRLAKYLKHPPIELRQLIQKQHAMVGEGDFTGLRATATVKSIDK